MSKSSRVRFGFLGYFTQYECVRSSDNNQWKRIDSDNVKEVVGQLVRRSGEEVECNTLGEPQMFWMMLHMENNTLKIQKDTFF